MTPPAFPPHEALPWKDRLGRLAARVRPAGLGFLGVERVMLQAHTGGQVHQQKVAPLAGSPDAAPEAAFSRSVHAWVELLQQTGLRGRRWKLVVADAWLRPLVLPLPGPTPDDATVERLVGASYRKCHGDSMADWVWRWDYQSQQVIAAALPSRPVRSLQSAIAQTGGVLAALAPLSVVAGHDAGTQGWLIVLDWPTFSIVRLGPGGWRLWSVATAGGTPEAEVCAQLARHAALAQDSDRPVRLVARQATPATAALAAALQAEAWLVQVHTYVGPGQAAHSDAPARGGEAR